MCFMFVRVLICLSSCACLWLYLTLLLVQYMCNVTLNLTIIFTAINIFLECSPKSIDYVEEILMHHLNHALQKAGLNHESTSNTEATWPSYQMTASHQLILTLLFKDVIFHKPLICLFNYQIRKMENNFVKSVHKWLLLKYAIMEKWLTC